MTATTTLTGAPSTWKWADIDWFVVENQVKRLQMRIAKAVREKRYGKAKSLQWLLTHSFYAKVLAVKRVVQNKGSKTPGVDGVIWNTDKQKMRAVTSLKLRGYKTSPLRRIYIPKRNGKKRPLSIPVMKCRAQQALHLLGLEPISETLADKNSYGFRPKRSTADANEQCFRALSGRHAAQWILEGDICSCFDKIKHGWLEANIPMNKVILGKWLKAGYVEEGERFSTIEGTPQGGIISPILLVMTLRGLEAAIKQSTSKGDKVNVVIYADDFIVTGNSKEILEQKVKPTIVSFLKERGLELSEDKTRITHINEGFDFLGFNIRKYDGKLLIKPSKRSVKDFLNTIRGVIKKNRATKTVELIHNLRPKIQGWANYHRHVVAKETFYYVDWHIFWALWRWAKRRHPMKNRKWVKNKYFRTRGNQNWIFSAQKKDKQGERFHFDLLRAGETPIKRYVKIRGDANPYDPAYYDYFRYRERHKDNRVR